jgi:DNA helicase-2/ATP-dependent DNA helicase PcrA
MNYDEIAGCKLSLQQTAFLTWIEKGTGSAVLEAVAGAGKTFTVFLAMRLIKRLNPSARVLYLVFNNRNKREAQDKAAQQPEISGCMNKGRETTVGISTFHGAGMQAWSFAQRGKKLDINVFEKRKLICEAVNIPSHLYSFVFSIMSKAMGAGLGAVKPLTIAALEELVDHYSLETEITAVDGESSLYEAVNKGIDLAMKAIPLGFDLAVDGCMTYDDQLYAPIKGKCRLLRYDYVFIDEAQDTSPIRRALAKAFLSVGGRLIAVGDRHQAIYGFTGADNDSLDLIAKEFNCQYMPLTASFRCGKKIVEFAQQWVNHITATEGAHEGEVIRICFDDLDLTALKPTDAILCRNSKPLIQLANKALSKGIACQILGKNSVGTALIKLITRWKSEDKNGKVVLTLPAFLDRLSAYGDKQVQALLAKGKEAAADAINDQIEAIYSLTDGLPEGSKVLDLKAKVESLFVDEDGNDLKEILTLSTIHKSKGFEWDRVYWLGRNKFQPSKFARQAWQMQQEINLMYVAATRAKHTLVDVVC